MELSSTLGLILLAYQKEQEKIMKELKFSERMSDNDNRSWEPIVEKANKDNQELKKVMLSRYKQ